MRPMRTTRRGTRRAATSSAASSGATHDLTPPFRPPCADGLVAARQPPPAGERPAPAPKPVPFPSYLRPSGQKPPCAMQIPGGTGHWPVLSGDPPDSGARKAGLNHHAADAHHPDADGPAHPAAHPVPAMFRPSSVSTSSVSISMVAAAKAFPTPTPAEGSRPTRHGMARDFCKPRALTRRGVENLQ